jgi:hypothetical protein
LLQMAEVARVSIPVIRLRGPLTIPTDGIPGPLCETALSCHGEPRTPAALTQLGFAIQPIDDPQ